MNGITVREIKEINPSLVAQLINIEENAFGNNGLHNEWLMIPMLRYGRVFIAELNKNAVGSAQLMRDWEDKNTAYFYGISIAPPYRGQGIGSYFMTEILTALKKSDFKKLTLTVSPHNHGAIHIYQDKLGFQKINYYEKEYGPKEDRISMELLL
ncbi:MAG: GNAT family N-acetyltransferase [Peptococcaceae bacterium]